MYNEVIYLVRESDQTDEYGDTVVTSEKTMVFAQKMSIGMKEFYQAHENGLKPELKFKIADYLDYDNQKRIEYENVTYKVLRTYQTDKNELEITVYGGVNNASTENGNEN